MGSPRYPRRAIHEGRVGLDARHLGHELREPELGKFLLSTLLGLQPLSLVRTRHRRRRSLLALRNFRGHGFSRRPYRPGSTRGPKESMRALCARGISKSSPCRLALP